MEKDGFDQRGYFARMRQQRPGVPSFRRTLGSPALFTIVYASVASAIYFALGIITDHALGLTPLVFLLGGVFFALTAMTYVEGASLHQDRGGATVFARYAFNELWSFVAGWAILLDYVLLLAVCGSPRRTTSAARSGARSGTAGPSSRSRWRSSCSRPSPTCAASAPAATRAWPSSPSSTSCCRPG